MTRVSESEFKNAVGPLTDKALLEPLTITRNGLDHVVIISAAEFARLKQRDRKVGLAADLPDEWIKAVREAKVPDEYAHLNADVG